ncbi:MAG: hypothetical protein ABEK17_03600 [Candidatus Aenigmatarchaeota archaeon]
MEEERRGRIKLIYGILSSISIFIGYFLFKFLSISTEKILTLPLTFPKDFLMLRMDSSFINTVMYFVELIFKHSIPLIPISVGVSLMVLCGMKHGESIRTTLTFFTLSSLLGLFYLGMTPSTIFLSVGIIAVGFFVSGMGETLPKELKKWENYRTGAKTIGKSLFVINILLALGAFTFLASDVYRFEDIYEKETKSIAMGMVPSFNETDGEITEEELISMLPEESKEIYEKLPEERKKRFIDSFRDKLKREDFGSQIERRIDVFMSSEKISALIDLSLLLIVLGIYGILEFLRTIIFSPIAGFVTYIGNKF